MIPMNFNEINDWEDLVIELDDGFVAGGQFTSMRIERNTVPNGLYAYDIRQGDDDSEQWICQVKNYVLVNHAGTFVTSKLIVNAAEGRDIADYSFDCTEEEYE